MKVSDQSSENRRAKLRVIIKEKELWLLVFVGILYFHRPLFLKETFFFRELWTYHIPQKFLLADFIQAKELPLWNSYLHGGIPFLADVASTTLYPFNVLYVFFSPLRAFNVICVMHLIASSLTAYCFTRVLGFRPLSSVITGLIYGYCGYILSFLSLLLTLLTYPYLPLLVLFWHLYLLEGKKRWFVITVLLGGMRVLVGAPEAQIIGMLFLLGWSLLYPYPQRKISQKIFSWILLGVFILGIASVQILPTLEMMAFSSRGQKMDYQAFSQWSLFPARLSEIFFPEFLGDYTKLDSSSYWGRNLVDRRFPYVANIYLGAIAVALAMFGGIYRNTHSHDVLPRRMRRVLLGVCGVSLMLSFGRFLPFFEIVYKYVPLISLFRYPIKFLMMGIFPLALLAGYASDIQFAMPMLPQKRQEADEIPPSGAFAWKPSLPMLISGWGIVGLLLIFTGMFCLSENFAVFFQENFFIQTASEAMYQGLRSSFFHTLTIWLLFVLLYQYRRVKITPWQHAILVGILVVDLLSAGRHINPTASEDFLMDTPPVVENIRDEIGDGRLFRSGMFFKTTRLENKVLGYDPSFATLQVPSNDIIWKHRWELELLRGYLGAFYKFPLIFHDGLGLAQTRLQTLKDIIYSLPWERRIPLLSAGGVALILTEEPLTVPGIDVLTQVRAFNSSVIYLYKNITGWI